MEQRSKQFNRFYYALIKDIHTKALKKHLTVENSEMLRNGLKKSDENYPRLLDGRVVSSADLTNKELANHIEHIIAFMGSYSIIPQFVIDDWERLKNLAKGLGY